MFRIDDPSAVSILPTPGTAGQEGYFTEGNPVSGVPATLVRADWLNAIQEEIRAVVVAGGLTPSKSVMNQLLLAIQGLINPSQSIASNGYKTFPGGLILQWMLGNGASGVVVNYPIAFPHAVFAPMINVVNGAAWATLTGNSSITIGHNAGSAQPLAVFVLGY